jgi:thiol-disulfide isomerase/thioredoxin
MFLNRYLFLLSLIMSGMAHGLEKNQPLPPVQLVTWENNTVDIDVTDLKGQVLYIDFWASWCIPCKKSFPFMNELHKTFAEQGLQVLAVNMDENRADAEKFLLRNSVLFREIVNWQSNLLSLVYPQRILLIKMVLLWQNIWVLMIKARKKPPLKLHIYWRSRL